MKIMSLQEEIDQIRQKRLADSARLSIGELITRYQNDEINIGGSLHWSAHQKSSLIESILIRLPIPSILVNEKSDGTWDVIDGVQRLSTIYQFVGILKSKQVRDNSPFTLQKSLYLPSLEGKKWLDPNDPDNSLTQLQRLLIKREKIAVDIIFWEIPNKRIKDTLSQRFNGVGSIATHQEEKC